MGLIFAILQPRRDTVSIGDGFRDFYLAFLTMVALTLQAGHPHLGLSQLPRVSVPMIHSYARERATKWALWTQWTHWEPDFSQNTM